MDLMLMKVIIMLMTVSFLEFILINGIQNLTWTALVIPATIISLSLALRWMQGGSESNETAETKATARPSDTNGEASAP